MLLKNKVRKKKLGIYYTPPELSKILSDWSINNKNDKILEPSFGGCGFLVSSLSRLEEIGAKVPKSKLCGVDIDPNAFEHLKNKININKNKKTFLEKCFLKVNHDEFNSKFSVIIGNPPYVSHEKMSNSLRKQCRDISLELGLKNITKSSLWGYFILHSLKFLRKGGRISFVLPGSSIYSDYSSNIFSFLKNKFKNISFIKIRKRIFANEGTSEIVVILLAENYLSQIKCKDIIVDEVSDIDDLSNYLTKNKSVSQITSNYKSNFKSFRHNENYLSLVKSSECKNINDYYSVRIGMVTGLKKFFILNKSQQEQFNLKSSVFHPVVSSTSLLHGIDYSSKDHEYNFIGNKNCLLFNPEYDEIDDNIAKYLDLVNIKFINKNQTFKNRQYWYQPDDQKIPDAFFKYLGANNHKVVLNTAKINCTNNIHRLFLRHKTPIHITRLISISMMSSFSKLSCETLGNEYASTGLKLEPSATKQINLLLPKASPKTIHRYFKKLDSYLRTDNYRLATNLADSFISKYSKIENIEYKINYCRIAYNKKLYKRLNIKEKHCNVD